MFCIENILSRGLGVALALLCVIAPQFAVQAQEGEVDAAPEVALDADGLWPALTAAESAWTGAVYDLVATMNQRIAAGVTGPREASLEKLNGISEALSAQDWPGRVEGLHNFLAFASESLQDMGRRELRNEPVDVLGLRKHAFLYRFGFLTEGFFSEDGAASGHLAEGGGWSFSATPQRSAARIVVETMRERRAPALVAATLVSVVAEATTWQAPAVELPDAQAAEVELPENSAEIAELERALNRVTERLAGLADRLSIHLSESPDRALFTLPDKGALQDRDNTIPWEARSSAALAWLRLYDEIHLRASRMQIGRHEIRTAAGALETVDLLSAGRMAFAYRSTDGQRIGYAVASPADAAGYRWIEGLDRVHEEALAAIFEAGVSATPVLHTLPVDVTGRIRAETAVREGGILAMLYAGGPVMLPLGLCALVALLLIGERFVFLQRMGRGRQRLAETVLAACADQAYDRAEDECRKVEGVVGRVLLACLRRRHQGQHAMEDTIQEQLLHEAPKLERFLPGIAVLGAVAPLFGLLGTVTGIIQTFDIITTFGSVQPGAMAGGISEALVTTASGLVVAIPILLLHSMLTGKADRIVSDAEKYAATLMLVLSGGEENTP